MLQFTSFMRWASSQGPVSMPIFQIDFASLGQPSLALNELSLWTVNKPWALGAGITYHMDHYAAGTQ